MESNSKHDCSGGWINYWQKNTPTEVEKDKQEELEAAINQVLAFSEMGDSLGLLKIT